MDAKPFGRAASRELSKNVPVLSGTNQAQQARISKENEGVDTHTHTHTHTQAVPRPHDLGELQNRGAPPSKWFMCDLTLSQAAYNC